MDAVHPRAVGFQPAIPQPGTDAGTTVTDVGPHDARTGEIREGAIAADAGKGDAVVADTQRNERGEPAAVRGGRALGLSVEKEVEAYEVQEIRRGRWLGGPSGRLT